MDNDLENHDITISDQQLIHTIQQAAEHVAQGKTTLQISCSEIETHEANNIISCHHSIWNPLLFACLAAEGVQVLYIHGVDQCVSCSKSSNNTLTDILEQYQALNTALAVKLDIKLEPMPQQENLKQSTPTTDKEPSRRTFFRTIIPTVAKHASDTIQQVAQTGINTPNLADEIKKDHRSIPTLSKLFLRALPALQINHLPVPFMPNIPLGSIQADDKCTACGDCVTSCPSHALSIRKFGLNRILEFQADCCTGCNLCVNSCPERAIEALPSINLPSLLSNKARPLVMINLNA